VVVAVGGGVRGGGGGGGGEIAVLDITATPEDGGA